MKTFRSFLKEEGPPKEVDSIGTLHAHEILTSRKSFDAATRDNSIGKGSRTAGPLEVHQVEDGRYLLTDGQHRFAHGVKHGQRTFQVKLIGRGYSDYWSTPRPEDEYKHTY